ncbi:PadR family transcriptional regulator [Tepidiforma sp.]|uniref:PadR family transcriptional regulator n=1 Tax=Tepidiforma sp. TaxID=2682230 RepID=UPI002ADD93BA|nr:PadR family transcriptional regulator [Tepidiforma sp.]
MRRKPGALLPLELEILQLAADCSRSGAPEFYGYQAAAAIRSVGGAALLAHGTLYKALDRLRSRGLLVASWEDPAAAEAEGRPRRRLYRITAEGQQALADAAHTALPPASQRLDAPGTAP